MALKPFQRFKLQLREILWATPRKSKSLKQIVYSTPKENVNALLDAVSNAITAYRTAMDEVTGKRAFAEAEPLFAGWKRFLEEIGPKLPGAGFAMQMAQWANRAGLFWTTRGYYEYEVNGDYIYSPQMFDKATIYHEEELKYYTKVETESSKGGPMNPDFKKIINSMCAMARSSMRDARGMKSMTEGEFALKIAAFPRAEQLLKEAVENLQYGVKELARRKDRCRRSVSAMPRRSRLRSTSLLGRKPCSGLLPPTMRSIEAISLRQPKQSASARPRWIGPRRCTPGTVWLQTLGHRHTRWLCQETGP